MSKFFPLIEEKIIRHVFGILIFLTMSSLVLLNKEEAIPYNIMINTVFIILYVVWLLFKRGKIIFNNYVLGYGVFTLYAFCSVLWTVDVDSSLELLNRQISVFITIVAVNHLLIKKDLFNYFYSAIIFSAFVNFLLIFIETEIIDIYENEDRFMGTMTNSNAISVVMIFNIFVSIILLSEKINIKKIVILNCNIFLSLYLILITLSRKGFIGGVFLYIVYMLFSPNFKNKAIFVFAIFAIMFYAVVYSERFTEIKNTSDLLFERFEGVAEYQSKNVDASTEERLDFIDSGIKMFEEKPILGWGVNTFRVFNDDHYSHNNYIEILSGLGVMGLFLYYLCYYFLIKRSIKNLKGGIRVYFVLTLVFFMFMDFSLVSYYERIFIIFMSFTSAYIFNCREESKV